MRPCGPRPEPRGRGGGRMMKPEDQFHAGSETGFLASVNIFSDGTVRAVRRGTAR